MTKLRSTTPCGSCRNGGFVERNRWTAQDYAALIDMWRSRAPIGEIAAKLGQTTGALRTRASWLSLPLSMCPDAFPDGKMGRCQGCRGAFFSKTPDHRFCDPCRRNWPFGEPDEASHTVIV